LAGPCSCYAQGYLLRNWKKTQSCHLQFWCSFDHACTLSSPGYLSPWGGLAFRCHPPDNWHCEYCPRLSSPKINETTGAWGWFIWATACSFLPVPQFSSSGICPHQEMEWLGCAEGPAF
jgi:hypothetical protein